jgi:hypothetical protein
MSRTAVVDVTLRARAVGIEAAEHSCDVSTLIVLAPVGTGPQTD